MAVFKAIDKVGSRLATLHYFDKLPKDVVLNSIGRAAQKKSGDFFRSLMQAREVAARAISDYRREHLAEPARPIFDHDDFGSLTQHVLRQIPAVLTAATERDFQVNGRPVDVAEINAFINEVLEKCELWDRHRNEKGTVNNRIVTEVRCFIARKLIANGRTPAVPENGIVLDQKPLAGMLPAVNPLSDFGAKELELERDRWTSSANLWAAWQDWCAAHGQSTGTRPSFFKNLCALYGAKIKPSKRRTSGGREPGYVGVGIQIPY